MKSCVDILSFFLGACAGSFLNLVSDRLPRRQTIVWLPSSCPACGTRLRTGDLVPLLSFICLAGRCRYCRERIARRYPLVELTTGALFMVAARKFGFGAQVIGPWIFLSILLVITLIDLKHNRIPNILVGSGLGLGLFFRLPFLPFSVFNPVPTGGWLGALWGLLAGGGVMLLVFITSRGGMGGGDVKLTGMLGLWLGLAGIILTMLLAFITGALAGMGLILTGRRSFKDALPFAPFLCSGALLALFWGETLVGWYLGMIGW